MSVERAVWLLIEAVEAMSQVYVQRLPESDRTVLEKVYAARDVLDGLPDPFASRSSASPDAELRERVARNPMVADPDEEIRRIRAEQAGDDAGTEPCAHRMTVASGTIHTCTLGRGHTGNHRDANTGAGWDERYSDLDSVHDVSHVVAEPNHSANCTRSPEGECMSMHCLTCGEIWHGGGVCPKAGHDVPGGTLADEPGTAAVGEPSRHNGPFESRPCPSCGTPCTVEVVERQAYWEKLRYRPEVPSAPAEDDAPVWMALSCLMDSVRDVCRDTGSVREAAINCLRSDLAKYDEITSAPKKETPA